MPRRTPLQKAASGQWVPYAMIATFAGRNGEDWYSIKHGKAVRVKRDGSLYIVLHCPKRGDWEIAPVEKSMAPREAKYKASVWAGHK